MSRSIGLWQFLGFSITSLVGTFLHFLYDLTNQSDWVASFSGVNESTFEHMKLLFWPMFLFAILQRRFFSNRLDFWCVKLRGILLGQALIPIIFYTYNGVIGPSPDWINISIFFVCATISYLYETIIFIRNGLTCPHPKGGLVLLILFSLLFFLFTFRTPTLGIFQDPLTGTYGI